jgi:hypothetical protein
MNASHYVSYPLSVRMMDLGFSQSLEPVGSAFYDAMPSHNLAMTSCHGTEHVCPPCRSHDKDCSGSGCDCECPYCYPSAGTGLVRAFSSAEVGEILPLLYVTMRKRDGLWVCRPESVADENADEGDERIAGADTEADARAKMAIRLKERGEL